MLSSSVALLPSLDIMLVNELLIKKLERFTCASIENSVLYSNSETKFVISLASDARSITAKELSFAFR